jgi:lauroyl/myristoyl acyltransferase
MSATRSTTLAWIPDHLAALAYYAGSAAVQLLPESFCRAVGRGCGLLCWALQGDRRRTVRRNLSRMQRTSKVADLAGWTRQAFTNFGASVVDTLRLASLDHEEVLSRVEFEDEAVLSEIGTGAVLLSAHTANWEWAGAALAARGFPPCAIARRHSPRVERFFARLRSRFGVRTEEGLLSGSREEQPGLLAIFCDRGGNMSRRRDLSRTARAAAALAARQGAFLIPTWMDRRPDGTYRVCFGPRLRPGRNRQQRVACALVAETFLTSHLRRSPEQWFAFERLANSS